MFSLLSSWLYTVFKAILMFLILRALEYAYVAACHFLGGSRASAFGDEQNRGIINKL